MAGQDSRWRTVVEIAVISAILYVLLGAPGLPLTARNRNVSKENAPKARAEMENLVYPSKNLQCEPHNHDIHIFSTNPLVIYIDDFLTSAEADHLIDLSTDKWRTSTVFNDGIETTDDTIRKSEKALIDRDETVECIEQRALSIQGWPPNTFIERLWTQRYDVSGHYAHHYDWAAAGRESRRVSTFMVYLGDECEGGGTNFPRLERRSDGRWCEFVECDEGANVGEGLTFKPKKGAAVFWMNFDADGRGYKETIHAGMPVTSGTKVGLNIWSWYQAGHAVVAEGEL